MTEANQFDRKELRVKYQSFAVCWLFQPCTLKNAVDYICTANFKVHQDVFAINKVVVLTKVDVVFSSTFTVHLVDKKAGNRF